MPLAAIYPGDGLMEADYPLALAPAAAADRKLKDIATRLIEHIRSASFAATIRERGFRPPATATPAVAPSSAALPDGLLAAYPAAAATVVALTDGRDQSTRFSVPRSEFLSRLSAARDPQRPVPVSCIGYGADADMEALNDISRATGGRAAASNDPGDLASAMAQIFLAAHAAQRPPGAFLGPNSGCATASSDR